MGNLICHWTGTTCTDMSRGTSCCRFCTAAWAACRHLQTQCCSRSGTLPHPQTPSAHSAATAPLLLRHYHFGLPRRLSRRATTYANGPLSPPPTAAITGRSVCPCVCQKPQQPQSSNHANQMGTNQEGGDLYVSRCIRQRQRAA